MVMVKSLYQETTSPERICLHLINRDLPPHILHVVEAYTKLAGASLEIIKGGPEALHQRYGIPPEFSDLKGNGHYDRLLAPYIIQDSRCLYLDTDILIQGDVAQLWQENIDLYLLAAAQDQNIPTVALPSGITDWKERGLAADTPYFNSGVMMLNLDRWRSERLASECIRVALHYTATLGESPPLHDQYALNVTCVGRWKALGTEWNAFADRIPSNPDEVRIVHFAGSRKPFGAPTNLAGSSKYFSRKAENLVREDLAVVHETSADFRRLEDHFYWLEQQVIGLVTCTGKVVPLAPSCDLGVAPDEGPVVLVIPVMIQQRDNDRFRNFCFLVRQYVLDIPNLVVVEQVIERRASSPVKTFLDTLQAPGIHYLPMHFDDISIHKSALINTGTRYACKELKARYVWHIDADIYVNAAAVINQLASLNSVSIPVIRPFLFFVRLTPEVSEEVLQMDTTAIKQFTPYHSTISHYQIIDLFGPGSVIFSREAFIASGGMDESFTGWGWEDMDFSHSLSKLASPHTLPLIGFHLHHEDDRAPRMENYRVYCENQHSSRPPEEAEREFVHTSFHNFQAKFCIIGDEASVAVQKIRGALEEIPGILFQQQPIIESKLPRRVEFCRTLENRIIHSLATSSDRSIGFFWNLRRDPFDPITKRAIPNEQLIDFLISSQFRILLVVPNIQDVGIHRMLVAKGIQGLLEYGCDKRKRSFNEVVKIFSDDIHGGTLSDSFLEELLSHFGVQHMRGYKGAFSMANDQPSAPRLSLGDAQDSASSCISTQYLPTNEDGCQLS